MPEHIMGPSKAIWGINESGVAPVYTSGTNYITQSGGYLLTAITDNTGSIVSVEPHNGHYALVTCTPDLHTSGWLSYSGDSVNLDVHGQGAAVMTVSGTWTGKIQFEGTIDDVYWVNLSIVQPAGGMTRNGVQNSNQNGSYRIPTVGGYKTVRATMATYTNGSAYIYFNCSEPVSANFVYQLNQSNLNATVFQTNGTGLHTVVDSGSITVTSEQTGYNQHEQVVFNAGSPTYNINPFLSGVVDTIIVKCNNDTFVDFDKVPTSNSFFIKGGQSLSADFKVGSVYALAKTSVGSVWVWGGR